MDPAHVRMVEHHVWLTGEMVARDRAPRRHGAGQADRTVGGGGRRPDLQSLCRTRHAAGDVERIASRDYGWSVEQHEAVESMRRRLAIEGPTFLAHVARYRTTVGSTETFIDALCEPAEVFTHGGMIAHVLTFAAHPADPRRRALIDVGIPNLARGSRLQVDSAA